MEQERIDEFSPVSKINYHLYILSQTEKAKGATTTCGFDTLWLTIGYLLRMRGGKQNEYIVPM